MAYAGMDTAQPHEIKRPLPVSIHALREGVRPSAWIASPHLSPLQSSHPCGVLLSGAGHARQASLCTKKYRLACAAYRLASIARAAGLLSVQRYSVFFPVRS